MVDQMSSMVIKFDPNGQVQMLLGRKAEAGAPAARAPPRSRRRAVERRGARRGSAGRRRRRRRGAAVDLPARAAQDVFQRPTDVAWDAAGNIYVADGFGNNAGWPSSTRTASSSSPGARRGTEHGQFNMVHGIAIDAQGNVYVADSGNKRIQVFDGDGTFKTQIRQRRALPRRFASRPDRASSSTARIRTRRKISTSPARSTRWT